MRHPIGVGFSVLVALVACKQGAGDDYGVEPGGSGGHPGGTNFADAPLALDGTLIGSAVTGRVCLTADGRDLGACDGSAAGGLAVQLGSSTAVTGADGRFTILVPPTPGDWHVLSTTTSVPIIESVMQDIGPREIPAIPASVYEEMITNTGGILLGQDQGGVMVRVRDVSGDPVVGATALSSDAASDLFYDPPNTPDPTAWTLLATGTFGVVWLPVVPVGVATITASAGSGSGTLTQVPVVDQAITFATVVVP